MRRRCICLISAACMAAILALPVRAEGQKGSVQIKPERGGEMVSGGTVSLSRVGGYTKGVFWITDGLANWELSEQDLKSSGGLSLLLQNPDRETMWSSVREISGAEFSSLEPGVYLVQQTEATTDGLAFRPFLLRIPEGEQWDMMLTPRSIYLGEPPKTGEHPAPIIAAMGIGLSIAVLMVLVDERRK